VKKIPTLFQRDEQDRKLVVDEINPVCQWVADGFGVPTRKWEGTGCMFAFGVFFKRHEMKRPDMPRPDGFLPAGPVDEITGKQPGWVPVGDGPEDRWHREALSNAGVSVADFDDGGYELVGPKIQGNLDRFDEHVLIRHGHAILLDAPRKFADFPSYFREVDVEGIVWWHEDGRRAKIKRRDFGIGRNS
jgi:hypothetical protein